jgi:hypothetical protein
VSRKEQKWLDNANAEIFYLDANEARRNRAELVDLDKKADKPRGWHQENSEHNGLLFAGWHYWCALPGCLPEGSATGPFRSGTAAAKDCIEQWGLYR